jgi:hypothetical protein
MRDVRTGGTPISRSNTDDVDDATIRNATNLGDIPRTTVRRRSYEKVMPFNGYYDRTGFNMPITFEMNQEVSGLPLGLIPSSLSYTPVTDHVDLPDIWRQCENVLSKNSYYEYPVSKTFLSRAKNLKSKNLIIFAGQSNMNGRGGVQNEAVNDVNDVNYWNIETSAFTNTIIPGVNTSISPKAGQALPAVYNQGFWGPEVEFAKLLVDNEVNKNNYIFKFCADNSWVVDTTENEIQNIAKQGSEFDNLLNFTWCPSSSRSHTVFNKFEEHLDLAITELGGPSVINDVYFIWNQGESEAAKGQDNDHIASQHGDATKLLIDTVKAKFEPSRFKTLRVKVNEDMGNGSEPDWTYYANGTFDGPSVQAGSFTNEVLLVLGNTSDAGSYGNWSWSSLTKVREEQGILDTAVYGTLLDVDDIGILSDDGDFNALQPITDGYTVPGVGTLYISGISLLSQPRKAYLHDNIHYVGSAVPELGRRFFQKWAEQTGLLEQADVRNDRGQLPDIYAAMHAIGEKRKVLQASASFGPASVYQLSVSNVYQSYANSSTEYDGAFPNTVNDYYNFSFGRDLHKLYNTYVTDFNRHKMNERMQYVDGANLFSHVYGPLIYNHDFEEVRLDIDTAPVITSSLSSIQTFNGFDSIFSGPLSYNASNPTDMYVETFEKVVSGLVPGVELVNTSGAPKGNFFSVFRIPSKFRTPTSDSYMYDNTFVAVNNVAGGPTFTRVRFDLSKYDAPSDRPISKNFLSPDCSYDLKFNFLDCNNKATKFGGKVVGVWLHTKPEDGKMWSYVAGDPNLYSQQRMVYQKLDENNISINKDSFPSKGSWVQHDALLQKGQVVTGYLNLYNTIQRERLDDESQLPDYECINIVNSTPEAPPISKLRKNDFIEVTLPFNTINSDTPIPTDYKNDNGLLHRKNQEYVVEVFSLGGNFEHILLIDSVSIQNMTLKKMSEIFVSGKYKNPLLNCDEPVGNCPEYRIELTKDELRKVFRFFNDISGKNSTTGLASRDKNETETIMGSEGGSKLDYRYLREWFGPIYLGSSRDVLAQIITNV